MDLSERRRIGSTGLEIPILGLGTAPIGGLYGGPASEADAVALIRRTYDLGIRSFDTAPEYGRGFSESRLGDVLPELPRDQIVVSTKAGKPLRPITFAAKSRQVLAESIRNGDVRRVAGHAIKITRRLAHRRAGGVRLGDRFDRGYPAFELYEDFSYDGVMRSIEASLARLRLDRVDILYIHEPDDHHDEALDGAFKALDRLRSEGAVQAVGVGMNQTAMLVRFANEAPFDCFLVGGRYTLLDHEALRELFPLCERLGISIVAGGVYNSGILADPKPGAMFDYKRAPRAKLERAQRIKSICARHGVPLMAAAIQFPLGHRVVASVLTGVRSVDELTQNVAMFEVEIPDALWQDLRSEGLLAADAPTPSNRAVA